MSVYSLTQEDSGKAARTRRITMYQVNEDPESFRAAQYRDGPEAASVPKSGTDGEEVRGALDKMKVSVNATLFRRYSHNLGKEILQLKIFSQKKL